MAAAPRVGMQDPETRVEIEGAISAHHTEDAIAGAAAQELFQGESSGRNFSVIFYVPAAKYKLEAGFAEIFWNDEGRRVFDAAVNGTPWLQQLDILKEAKAKNRAVIKTLDVDARDGSVRVDFHTVADRAKFSYLKLEGAPLREPILVRGGSLAVTGAPFSKTRKEILPKTPPDFEATIVAQDPEIAFPTVIAAAPARDGRPELLFVAEDMYNAIPNVENEKPDLDRILRLEIDPATGRAARITEFSRGFGSIQGLCYIHDTLFVAAAPEVTALRDADGDGVAEERETILTDCGPAPGIFGLRHHIPSGLQYGIDGKLILSIGDHGCRARNRFGAQVDLEGGGSLRFAPDGRDLEIFTSGLRNTLHHCENEIGEWFTRDNTNDGDGWDSRLFHLIPGGNYGYPYLFKKHPDEILQPIGEYGGGSSTGTIVYQEMAFPPRYRGRLFACDWARREIYAIQPEPSEATYKPNVELFMSQEEGGAHDLRPTDLAVDGRGDLIIADWSRDGWGQSERIGRILRIHAKGSARAPEPVINDLAGAVEALKDARRSVRDRATQWLRISNDNNTDAALAALAENKEKNTTAAPRIHALWILTNRRAPAIVRTLSNLLHEPSDPVAAQAARALGDLRDGRALEPLVALLNIQNVQRPFARREAAIAIGKIANSWVPALANAADETDPTVAFCKVQAIRRIGKFEPLAAALASANARESAAARRALADIYDPRVVRMIADAIHDPRCVASRAELIQLIGRVALLAAPWNGVEWWGTQPRTPRSKIYKWEGTELAVKEIAEALASTDSMLQNAAIAAAEESPAQDLAAPLAALMRRSTEPNQLRIIKILRAMCSGVDAIVPFGNDEKAAIRAAVAEVLAGLEGEGVGTVLLSLSKDSDENVARRALESLRATAYPDAAAPVLAIYQNAKDDKIRAAAAWALERQIDAKAPAEFEKIGGEMLADPNVREQGINILKKIGTRASLAGLIKIAAGESPAGRSLRDAALQACARIAGSGAPAGGGDEAALDRWFAWAAREIPNFNEPPRAAGGDARKRFVKLTMVALERKGNIEKGRAIFMDPAGAKCSACHVVGNEGTRVGPDLSDVGLKYSKTFIIESILEPGRVIHSGYEATVVEIDGESPVSGTVISENSELLEIVAGPGATRKIPKKSIRSRSIQPLSPMPAGLADALDENAFADLVEYLANCKINK